jgi:hypothetical protein
MKFLSNPVNLKPLMKKGNLLQVIIETTAGSRNKFAFDPDQCIFALKKVLSAGMVFPYDFGSDSRMPSSFKRNPPRPKNGLKNSVDGMR